MLCHVHADARASRMPHSERGVAQPGTCLPTGPGSRVGRCDTRAHHRESESRLEFDSHAARGWKSWGKEAGVARARRSFGPRARQQSLRAQEGTRRL